MGSIPITRSKEPFALMQMVLSCYNGEKELFAWRSFMKYDFEIYINIIAILFLFYVFLTFSEKKKYIENLAAGFALYLIALTLLLFSDSIISKTGEVLYYILLKSAYFASPFFIYNAIS